VIAPRANNLRCGLDIGGTQIKAVLIDSTDAVVSEFLAPSLAHLGPEKVKDSLLTLLETISRSNYKVDAVGIGCAGSVDSDKGIVRNSPNFSDWKDIDLRYWIQEATDKPVIVDNDANCAALAEWKLGKGRGFKNLVLLTLGTGVGGGLVLNNRIYRGSTGTGAELGHFSIFADGIPCPCGNIGCFERYCSASALKSRLPEFSAKEIFQNVTTNNKCRMAVEEFIRNLQTGLVSLANIFDPDIILLGGAVSLGLISYIDEIRETIKARCFPAIGANLKIEFTHFSNNSGAIGAALLHGID
jgi:glucokinase